MIFGKSPFAPFRSPHSKSRRLCEIQAGGRRVQEQMGACFSRTRGRGRYCENREMFFQFLAGRW